VHWLVYVREYVEIPAEPPGYTLEVRYRSAKL